MRALSSQLGFKVLVVVPQQPAVHRRSIGWDALDYGDANLRIEASPEGRRAILEANRDAIAHVFSSIASYPELTEVLTSLVAGRHGHVAALTESWDDYGTKGILRSARSHYRAKRYGKYFDSVFACGEMAERQMRAVGFAPEAIVPFGYFVESPVGQSSGSPHGGEVIYVGSLEEWKSPQTLLEAFSDPILAGLRLTIVGTGSLEAQLRLSADRLGIGGQVSFRGNLSGPEVRHLIGASDLLVLPSRYDGWGAVVPEALTAGTPVVASYSAGASTLLVSPLQGARFRVGDSKGLASAIDRTLEHSDGQRRAALADWAAEAISPSVMARYLVEQLQRSRSTGASLPPWRHSRGAG